MRPRTVLLTLILLVVAVASLPPAMAAEYEISGIELDSPEPVAGEQLTYTIRIANTGSQEVEFTSDATMRLLIDGEVVNNRDFLVDPNYQGPAIYLSVQPGETESWTIRGIENAIGDKEVEIRIEGTYLYGGTERTDTVSTTRTLTFVNPPVEAFEIWLTRTGDGIKPSISIGNGRAYTGDLGVRVMKDGTETFSSTYTLDAENGIAPLLTENDFYSGDGAYTMETSFGGKKNTVRFTYESGGTDSIIPTEDVGSLETADSTPAPAMTATPTPTATPTETPTQQPTEDASTDEDSQDQEQTSPGFLAPLTAMALLAAAAYLRRQ